MARRHGGDRDVDPYLYPGTRVLRNKFGIRDAAALERAELRINREQAGRLVPDPRLSAEGFKAIHRHLFGQVYAWAGETRTVSLAKGDAYFGPPQFVETELARRFRILAAEDNLCGLDTDRFAERSAEHVSELNAIHPFREGNGRTTRMFLEILARQAGHELDRTRIDKREWMCASIAGMNMDYRPMAGVIRMAIVDDPNGSAAWLP